MKFERERERERCVWSLERGGGRVKLLCWSGLEDKGRNKGKNIELCAIFASSGLEDKRKIKEERRKRILSFLCNIFFPFGTICTKVGFS